MSSYYTIEQFEDALIERLDSLKTNVSVRTIKSYQDDFGSDDLLAITKSLPAIYVIYNGSRYADRGPRKVEYLSFVFFIADKNLRSEEEARRGGSYNPGTYAILDALRERLYGYQLFSDVYPLEGKTVNAIWHDSGISIYATEYEFAQLLLYHVTQT